MATSQMNQVIHQIRRAVQEKGSGVVIFTAIARFLLTAALPSR
jgi:hypothetical protein